MDYETIGLWGSLFFHLNCSQEEYKYIGYDEEQLVTKEEIHYFILSI